MRTLVIGIPLPHTTFDNHSFFSAPSLADYRRVIVEIETASKVAAEVVKASPEHKTYTGLPVRNTESTTEAIGLADVLAMRRREAEWFLKQGGVLCCFAHPDVAVKGVRGQRSWRRYSWLPAPPDFSYADDMFPAFGKVGGGASAADHPFARYIEKFGQHASYRVCFNEDAQGFRDYSRVFSRSEGGAAIGVEMRVFNGAIIFLPPLVRLESDRSPLSSTLVECFDSFIPVGATAEAS